MLHSRRRPRPTIRCLTEDLGLDLPPLDVDLGDLKHPWLDELRRIAPRSPVGQKRILAIGHPLVYRLRVSSARGATWVDDEQGIVWLCAVHRREVGSETDAYTWFSELHTRDQLLPSDDDRLRDRAEAVTRLQRGLRLAFLQMADRAVERPGNELKSDLGDYLPCRLLVLGGGELQEIWCALGVFAADGSSVRAELRDVLFVALEEHLAPAVFEARSDWPTGELRWWEVVRFGIR